MKSINQNKPYNGWSQKQIQALQALHQQQQMQNLKLQQQYQQQRYAAMGQQSPYQQAGRHPQYQYPYSQYQTGYPSTQNNHYPTTFNNYQNPNNGYQNGYQNNVSPQNMPQQNAGYNNGYQNNGQNLPPQSPAPHHNANYNNGYQNSPQNIPTPNQTPGYNLSSSVTQLQSQLQAIQQQNSEMMQNQQILSQLLMQQFACMSTSPSPIPQMEGEVERDAQREIFQQQIKKVLQELTLPLTRPQIGTGVENTFNNQIRNILRSVSPKVELPVPQQLPLLRDDDIPSDEQSPSQSQYSGGSLYNQRSKPQFAHSRAKSYHFPRPVTFARVTGARKALVVGVQYSHTTLQLNGSIHDSLKVVKFLTQRGFQGENILYLTDELRPSHTPTKAHIMRALKWLLSDANEGDSLFFYFAGHGKFLPTTCGHASGYDEVLLPLDWNGDCCIRDHELFDSLILPLPEGARLTIVLDACKIEGGIDLPFFVNGDNSTLSCENDTINSIIQGDIVLFSSNRSEGCVNSDGESIPGGVLTSSWVGFLHFEPSLTYLELLNGTKKIGKAFGLHRSTQLYASKPFDLNQKFDM